MKKNDEVKKSRKARAEKKAVRKPRLTKEEREARKLKLQEERAAKKAARLAKREAKKQKEAERKAAAKAKREERKAKKLARLQKQKERKAALKLKAKERAEKKRAKAEKKGRALPKEAKLSAKEKIEAERNEWKALSALRRYVKDNAKILASLPEDKRIKRINKLQKMGYSIGLNPDGTLSDIGYSFCAEIKIRGEKPAAEKAPKKERKPRKPRAEKTNEDEVQQPQNSDDGEEKLLTDEEILEAAKADAEAEKDVEVPVGDTFADETEIAATAEEQLDTPSTDDDEDEDEDEDDDEDDENDDKDDILGGREAGISREQEEYRQESFREMEANGTWD